ncbi:MAG: hypothetical protein OXH06_14105 [Gemmatimonadetes bacterium]|nr:hypothetical protein [Gemmatimonadota bacterium]MDE3259630.1 hypothetical protein [Gemmatimonadota bacterium]
MIDGIKRALLILLTLGVLALVVVFDPENVSDVIRDALDIRQSPPPEQVRRDLSAADRAVRRIVDAIAEDDVRSHVAALTRLPSRVVGYGGERQARDYIRSQFEALGLERVTTETFDVTVPVDRGGVLKVTATGEEIPIYGLWPNDVRTPTLPAGGVEGHLIYGRRGEFKDFNGSVVDGSVVLMDFGCGQNYLNAMTLGAKAILFFDDGNVTRGEAEDKFLEVPVNVPRFWVNREDAHRLLNEVERGDVRVRLTARMDWKTVQSANVLGYLPGSEDRIPGGTGARWKDRLIVVGAYYDAMSVVPALAPGAESASGAAALLEVIRSLQRHGSRHSFLFLATSAHFEGLTGINDFLFRHSRRSDYFRDRIPEGERIDFSLFVGLDLSSRSRQVGGFAMGTFYNARKGTDEYLKNLLTPYSHRFREYTSALFPDEERYVDVVAPAKRPWTSYMPVPLALESEAAVFVGQEAMTLVTLYDGRVRTDTPLDVPEVMAFGRLTDQVRSVAAMMIRAGSDPGFFRETQLRLMDRGHRLSGRILWFDRDVDFAIPRVPVPGSLVTYKQPGPGSLAGVRTLMVTQTTKGPIYEGPASRGALYGSREVVAQTGRFEFDIVRNRFSNQVLAYELDAEGRIVSAPDMGIDGAGSDGKNGKYPLVQGYGWWDNEMMGVLFRCRSLSLFEIVDSSYLSVLDHMKVLGRDNSEPIEYGFRYVANQGRKEGKVTQASVAFAPPGERIKILMSSGLFGIKYLLINAPEDLLSDPVAPRQVNAETVIRSMGAGYVPDGNAITLPSYRAARDMWIVDDVRMKQLARYGVENQRLSRLHDRARASLLEAEGHLKNLRYDRFIASAREGWGLEARGYPEVKETANDTVRGVIFYFVLLLPFSFFCERLFFGFPDVQRRIVGFAAILIAMFLALRWVHPAFQLSSSPYIIFLAFVILCLGGVAMVIVVSRFAEQVRRMKQSATGVYEEDVGRISAMIVAFTLGVSNLRKRPLRSGLTAVTLTLLTFTVLSFTSVQTYLRFYKLPRDNRPPYQGALVRDRNWRGMQPSALTYIQSHFGGFARVAPRAFYISEKRGERAYIDFEEPESGRRSFANGLLGVTPVEPHVLGMDRLLTAGRWFREGERHAVILPGELADLVGITGADVEAGRARVRMLGVELAVVGILDSRAVDRLADMDDERPTPIDTTMETAGTSDWRNLSQDPRLMGAEPIEAFIHLDTSNTALLPYEFVIEIGGTLRSIAITDFKDAQGNPSQDVRRQIEDFMSRVALTMFVGIDDEVTVYSSIGTTSLSGIANLFIPLVIASLIVLNTMMGAVYERFREIGVYSAVGLAPSHISALFLAEAAVFATLGAAFGYLIGQALALVLYEQGALGGLSLNYSSLSAVSSTLLVMLAVFLSTLYPARKAEQMSVPDVTRRWQFPNPDGDDWTFDFPFTLAGSEALGMYTYLFRSFESFGEGSLGRFVSRDVRFGSNPLPAGTGYRIALRMWLAPYDLGISQDVQMVAIPTGEHDIYRIEVRIHRLSGDVNSWQRVNRGFLNDLRKLFLVWKTMPPDTKTDYARQGEAELETPPVREVAS